MPEMIACHARCRRLMTVKKKPVDPLHRRMPVRGATDAACLNDAEPGALKIAICRYSLDSLGLHGIPDPPTMRFPWRHGVATRANQP